MRATRMTWRQAAACVSAGIGLLCPLNVYSACWGDADVVTEYLFYDDGDDVVVNTGIDEDDGNAALINGADFSGDVPPSNLNCGWSVSIPGTGSGAGTPAVETDEEYDPFAGASRFTIMAWVRRESSSTGSNTSARVVSDTSSLTLNGATAGVEFRFGGSAGSLYLRVNGNEVGTTTSSISPDSGEWRHVAVVYDGTRPATNYLTRNVHFYVDGIQCGHGNVLQSVVVGTNASRLTLGNSAVSRGIGNTMVGKMDDVIILYDVAPEAVGNGNSNETIRCYMELNDDIVPPAIESPPNVTVDADPDQCSSTNVNLGQPIASDNCGIATIANDAPFVFPVGATPVVWTATDYAGNAASATQTVTVVDAEAPVFVGVSNVTVDAGACLASVTNLVLDDPDVTDNCGVASLYSSAPAVFQLGTNVMEWHAWDAAGNHADASQQVLMVPSRVADCDGDGLTDYEEALIYFTDPEISSTAGDGISDGWKVQYGFDPTLPVPAGCRPRNW